MPDRFCDWLNVSSLQTAVTPAGTWLAGQVAPFGPGVGVGRIVVVVDELVEVVVVGIVVVVVVDVVVLVVTAAAGADVVVDVEAGDGLGGVDDFPQEISETRDATATPTMSVRFILDLSLTRSPRADRQVIFGKVIIPLAKPDQPRVSADVPERASGPL